MYLHGSFISKRKEVVTVEIVTGHDRTREIEIGGTHAVFPADSPVEIRSEVNDTFDPLFRSSATVRVLTRDLLGDLFACDAMDAVVNISVDGRCVFAGYVEPQTYSQPFNAAYDELELNCIDAISAMQFYRYRRIGTLGSGYDDIRANAGNRTLSDIVSEIIGNVSADLDLSGESGVSVLYDGSVTVPGASGSVFDSVALSELLFLGSSEDEVWTQLEVMDEVMRYLGLHMIQEGLEFKVYSLDTAKMSAPVQIWQDLSGEDIAEEPRKKVMIALGNAASNDTQVSIGEVYNRIELTCDVTEMENLVESPLDSETLGSPFTNRQLYCKGHKMLAAFDGYTSWFIQVRDSRNWKFNATGFSSMSAPGTQVTGAFTGTVKDIIGTYCTGNSHQERVPDLLANTIGAALLSWGSVADPTDSDNTVIGKIAMTDSLVVSVNGNQDDTQTGTFPRPEHLLQAAPVAEYTGNVSGGVFSPADDDTVNYIVISGDIVLNPVYDHYFRDFPDYYYGFQWYGADHPTDEPYEALSQLPATPHLLPCRDERPKLYQFNYSAIGDGTDEVSKVAAIACMLIIGDKCVVETGTQGQPGDFVWRKYKTREECADDDEYWSQCFTIGFDPKIGDCLIGQDFPIQNNIDYRMGLDTEGTAIPVRKNDKVSGRVEFRILGPVYTLWGQVTRRHPTWFRSTSWSSETVPLMAHVQSIFIKDFEITLHSDNGLINNIDNSDLMYVSDTTETFRNVKDDLSFRVTTALTKEERVALGVSDSVKLSSPLLVETEEPLLTVCNMVTGEAGKPEQLYVDAAYREWHEPRVTMTHKLRTGQDTVGLLNHYLHPALPGKEFFVTGISRDLMEGWAEMQLKEIEPSKDTES